MTIYLLYLFSLMLKLLEESTLSLVLENIYLTINYFIANATIVRWKLVHVIPSLNILQDIIFFELFKWV